jgi:hypothetical protein
MHQCWAGKGQIRCLYLGAHSSSTILMHILLDVEGYLVGILSPWAPSLVTGMAATVVLPSPSPTRAKFHIDGPSEARQGEAEPPSRDELRDWASPNPYLGTWASRSVARRMGLTNKLKPPTVAGLPSPSLRLVVAVVGNYGRLSIAMKRHFLEAGNPMQDTPPLVLVTARSVREAQTRAVTLSSPHEHPR